MCFTFINKISIVFLLLPDSDRVLRSHIDQHELFFRPSCNDDLFPGSFFRHLDLKILPNITAVLCRASK